ncbi:MAG: hypothetical protein J6S36_04000, partial [Eggerthellaceae bacterium]|nr:hypothetical protein [Eggerthellaceae bacterium]
SVRQIVRAACPPAAADAAVAWPGSRNAYAQAYGQREAEALFGEDPRIWSTDTVAFADDGDGSVKAVRVQPRGAGELYEVPAGLVLIAKGFTGPEQAVLDAFAPFANVHVAGDARMGSTLVATAMADALHVATQIADELNASN